MPDAPLLTDPGGSEPSRVDANSPVPAGAPSGQAGPRGSRHRLFVYRYAVVIVLILFIIGFSLGLPRTFFTTGNFVTILSSQAVLLILALGLTFPLITGEFDLSVAAMLGFGAVLLAALAGIYHWPGWAAIITVLAIGALVGVVNAFFTVHLGVNAFIVTLGTGTVLTGLTLLVSGGQILNGVPNGVQSFATHKLLGLPLPVWLALVFALVLWWMYEQTPLGRYLYFVGEGREVARLAGLPVKRLRFFAFVGAGFVSSSCGILAAGQFGSGDPSVGGSYLLPAYAAVFLGAATIKPGRFNVWGTVIALYMLVTGVTGLELMGVSSWVEQVFNGAALVIAVTFARLVARDQAAR
jgi:ribose transport system permease protein